MSIVQLFRIALFTIILWPLYAAQAQETKRILFIGNSYTYVNNLPLLIERMAESTGDSVYHESSTPGGYSLQAHFSNSTTTSLIKAGIWDFVVLQDQSQIPSFPEGDVEVFTYPYALKLDSLINLSNPCAETMFYMTWGRKNGDASNCNFWPPVCTYKGMDSLLNLRYRKMSVDNHARVSPVGEVWRYLRENHPGIELYQSDESHPSIAGSYAAACCFYACIFGKDPGLINYDYILPPTMADTIRQAARKVVFNHLDSTYGFLTPIAGFTFTITGNSVQFSNTSVRAKTYSWNFGDGSANDSSTNPTHVFSAPGTYAVQLIASDCPYHDKFEINLELKSVSIQGPIERQLTVFPNPVMSTLFIQGSGPIKSFTIEIYSLDGRRISDQNIKAEEDGIDVNMLPSGIYLLRIEGYKPVLFQKE